MYRQRASYAPWTDLTETHTDQSPNTELCKTYKICRGREAPRALTELDYSYAAPSIITQIQKSTKTQMLNISSQRAK